MDLSLVIPVFNEQDNVRPLQDEATVQRWLKANRSGYVLVNNKTPLEKLPAGVWGWPYRGGSLILWPAAWLLSEPDRLDAKITSSSRVGT